jgi:hypothetical protein
MERPHEAPAQQTIERRSLVRRERELAEIRAKHLDEWKQESPREIKDANVKLSHLYYR